MDNLKIEQNSFLLIHEHMTSSQFDIQGRYDIINGSNKFDLSIPNISGTIHGHRGKPLTKCSESVLRG